MIETNKKVAPAAQSSGYAVGVFNVQNLEGVKTITEVNSIYSPTHPNYLKKKV